MIAFEGSCRFVQRAEQSTSPTFSGITLHPLRRIAIVVNLRVSLIRKFVNATPSTVYARRQTLILNKLGQGQASDPFWLKRCISHFRLYEGDLAAATGVYPSRP